MRYDLGLFVFFAWCKLTELGIIFFKYGICLNDLYILLYGLKVTFSVLREENMIHPNVLTWTEDLSQVSAVVTWWSSLSFLLEHLTVEGVKRYQPFNCISWMVLFTKSASKWPKLPTGTRLFLWNRDRKRCLHIPHIHLPLVNVTTFFFSVFTVTPKMLYYLYLLSYSSHSVSGDNF